MKIYLAAVLTLNLFLLGFILQNNNNKSINPSLAKIAVREKLEDIPEFAPNEPLKLTSGCADAGNGDGLISGLGKTSEHFQHIEQIPVNRSTRFSYQAKVSAACWSYNLNCYGVKDLALEGTTFVAPRL
jgi:hypothetical protein